MKSQRFLAMLFTDIVGSTERAADLRNDAWQALRRQHNAVVRRELRRFGGSEVNTAGGSVEPTMSVTSTVARWGCQGACFRQG